MVHGGTAPEIHALRSLHDLITTVHSGQDLEEVLQTAARGVVDVLGFQVAVIDCVDPFGYVEALAVAGDDDACAALKGRRVALTELENEFAIAEDWGLLKFVPHDRLPEDAEYSWVPADFEQVDGPDAWHPLDALYALLNGPTGELLGMLSVDLPVDRRRPNALTRQVLEMYAVQAGLAIHHAQERARLQERVRLAGANRTIVETASREEDLPKILDAVFPPLAEGLHADRLVVRAFPVPASGGGGDAFGEEGATYPHDLVDHLEDRLDDLVGVGVGVGGGAAAVARLRALGERLARACWPHSRTVVAAELGDTCAELMDDTERALVADLAQAIGASSLMLVPLGAGPECVGYLLVGRGPGAAPWTAAEDEAARQAGREIGRAVQRGRLRQRERQLLTQLQELDRYKAEMIDTITHELKNPLTSISGHVELLEDEGVAPVSVEAIARNVGRLRTMVDDMLLLSHVRDPHRPFAPECLDAGALVTEVCDLLAIQAAKRRLTVDTSAVVPEVPVWGEREELTRLLTNVLGNAVKYTPDGGTVTLAVEADGEDTVVMCTDTGIGIAESDIDSLFEEFDRSSNPDAHVEPGSGLGLAIVRRIVERHGGSIEVSSVLGEGTTFRVTLPSGPAEP
jgi:signal transduction histidine kinase